VVDTRTVCWEGFHNARDLGGLRTADGGCTRRGALIRPADLRFVTPDGWRAAFNAGIRTVIDLRNDDEVEPNSGSSATRAGGSASFEAPVGQLALPVGMTIRRVPIDDVEDIAFWRRLNGERLNGTPLYFRPFIEAKPERCAAALTAIARAQAGGVIFHCGAGRDRTGLVALLVLSLVGVLPDAIADDYEISASHLGRLFAALGQRDQAPLIDAELKRRGTSARAAVLDALDGLEVAQRLGRTGLNGADIKALRGRMLG
jgi:protein-tyrosine phosphatase